MYENYGQQCAKLHLAVKSAQWAAAQWGKVLVGQTSSAMLAKIFMELVRGRDFKAPNNKVKF